MRLVTFSPAAKINVLPPSSWRQARVHRTLAFDCSSQRHDKTKKKQMLLHLLLFYGAGDEARTRYLHLGKVALYRMSYARNEQDVL